MPLLFADSPATFRPSRASPHSGQAPSRCRGIDREGLPFPRSRLARCHDRVPAAAEWARRLGIRTGGGGDRSLGAQPPGLEPVIRPVTHIPGTTSQRRSAGRCRREALLEPLVCRLTRNVCQAPRADSHSPSCHRMCGASRSRHRLLGNPGRFPAELLSGTSRRFNPNTREARCSSACCRDPGWVGGLVLVG